jgi:hypothetical protein
MYSVQLLLISLLPSLLLSSPPGDPPTPPSREMAFTTVVKSPKDVLGCLRRDDCQCGLLMSRSLLSSLQMGGHPRQPCIPPGGQHRVQWTPEQKSCPHRRRPWGRIDFLCFGGWLKSGGWDEVQLGKHQTLVWVRMIRQILNWHCFLHDKHTTFYVYYMWAQSDKVVSVSASIRRPS